MNLVEKYLNEGKNIETYVVAYPEVDTLSDGLRALKQAKKFIENNYSVDGDPIVVNKKNVHWYFGYETGKKTVFKKKPKEKIIIVSWDKNESGTYKSKVYNELWNIVIEGGPGGFRYQITNDKDIKRYLDEWGIPKK